MKKSCANCRWSLNGKPNNFGYEHDGSCDDCSLDPNPPKPTVNWEARFIKCVNCGFWDNEKAWCPEFDEERGMNDTCPDWDIRYQKIVKPTPPVGVDDKGGKRENDRDSETG